MSQLGTTSTNNNPVIGGSGVTKVTADGTMGPFTVDVASLAADTEYHFKAYATNSAGTSYSDVSTFSTLSLQLLGLAQVQWVEESSMQPRLVPQFVYTRAASEVGDSLTYQVKLSSDLTNWVTVDQVDWEVEDSAQALRATWISSSSPPAQLFFRVEVAAAN
jgi:hypothetical protein